MDASKLGRKAVLSQLIMLALGTTTQAPVLAQQDSDVDEVVVVTGSRIVRRDFTAQTPIVTLESESFVQRSNIGLEATLNQLPQFHTAGTQAQGSPASTPFPAATAAPGAATLNMRGLGLNRSLVLVNGRRVQPVNGNLVVDLNTIPSAAIDRVEVITGGAAAVYGADAIAGVVNFILKSDFEGLEFRSQLGVTQEGDGEEFSINGLFGTDFADGTGNVMIGADYSKREIIYGRDRGWIRAGWFDPGTIAGGLGSSNLSQFVPDPANAPADGWFSGRNYFVDQNGALFDAQNPSDSAHPYTGPIDGASGFRLNPDGSLGFNDFENSFLQLPLERYSIFGNGHIELADNVELFTEMRYSETVAEAYGAISGLFNVWTVDVPYNPLYDDPASPTFGQAPAGIAQHPVPAELAALLNSREDDPAAPWTYAGGIDWLPPWQTITTSNVYQVIGGLRGEVNVGGRDWFWNAFASHGKTSVLAHQPEGFPYLPRVQNLFTADQYGRGFNLSQLPNYYPLSVTGDCTSGLPIFNPDGSVDDTPSVSRDCNDYVTLRMNTVTRLTQDVVEANLSGALADLPAGEVLFALGAGTREETFNFDPDSGYNANQDYPNVVQNIILPVTVAGSTDVTEVFGEMAIPLVRDKKFVQSFELDPGFRYSDYSSVGSEETYKLLFDWTVNDRLRFRGGKQVATRAPNIAELFTPKGGSQIDLVAQDPCGYWPTATQSWGNRPENPNRTNVQLLCQHLMVRDGAPASLYDPGGTADTWAYNVFGAQTNFPFSIAVTQGNPNLESETADTYTFGMVLGFDRWTLAVDWYEIELENAIGIPGFAVVYQQCMDPQYNPLLGAAPGTYTGAELAAGNQFCDLINREYVGGAPLTDGNYGAARNFNAAFINQGGLLSQGVDVQFDWGTSFNNGGLFSLSVLATILDKYAESAFPGAEFVDLTGTESNSSFDYRTFTTFNYAQNAWSVGLRWEHMPSLDNPPGSPAGRVGAASYNLFDLFANWQVGDRYTLRGGIDNLLNKDPVVIGRQVGDNNLGSTNPNYDPFGRRFYVGLSISM